jgi:hypothetical protein
MSEHGGPVLAFIRHASVLAVCVALRAPATAAQRPTHLDPLRDYWAARSNAVGAHLNRLRVTQDSTITDTTRALRFDIVSSASLAPLSMEIAHLADSLVRTTWTPPRPGPRLRFILHPTLPSSAADLELADAQPVSPARLVLSILDPERGRTEITQLDSVHPAISAARATLRRSVVEPLLNAIDPDLRQWLVDRPSVDAISRREWRGAWLALATFPSLPARGCLVGEMRACEAALGLSEETDPLRAWYDPTLRQVLGARGVPGWRGSRLSDTQRRTVDACASGKDDTACFRFLSDTSLGADLVAPGPKALRSLLVRFAFAFPADSAARAQAAYTPGLTIRDRLSRASGLPFDELLRRFHTQLSERRPPPTSPGAALLWASSLWCLAFGAASLGSTRWRE